MQNYLYRVQAMESWAKSKNFRTCITLNMFFTNSYLHSDPTPPTNWDQEYTTIFSHPRMTLNLSKDHYIKMFTELFCYSRKLLYSHSLALLHFCQNVFLSQRGTKLSYFLCLQSPTSITDCARCSSFKLDANCFHDRENLKPRINEDHLDIAALVSRPIVKPQQDLSKETFTWVQQRIMFLILEYLNQTY